jgi:hypothetical protein
MLLSFKPKSYLKAKNLNLQAPVAATRVCHG